ncbi:MAG: hypothetical protein K9G59_12570 [Caulobacter sp.]|nr:hypothetical protein [Caulobacter sp.]
MTHAHLILAAALTLALAACDKPAATPAAPAEPAAPAAPATPAMPLKLALTGDGLTVVAETGSTQLLAFSRDKVQTLVTMTRVEPAPGVESVNSECGAGPLTFVAWPGGLTLLFQEDRFAGWTVDKPGLTTMDGIGVGSTRAELLAARPGATVEESTLGTEFAVADMGGLFDGKGPDAKIDTLWAGVTCMFR